MTPSPSLLVGVEGGGGAWRRGAVLAPERLPLLRGKRLDVPSPGILAHGVLDSRGLVVPEIAGDSGKKTFELVACPERNGRAFSPHRHSHRHIKRWCRDQSNGPRRYGGSIQVPLPPVKQTLDEQGFLALQWHYIIALRRSALVRPFYQTRDGLRRLQR